MVVDRVLADAFGRNGAYSQRFASAWASASIQGQTVFFQKPQEYMNLSGRGIQQALAFYKLPVDRLIVVHDELDLSLGVVRVKEGGGEGGHNGLRSVSQQLGSSDYVRVRCGIGRPAGGQEAVVRYVLSPFAKSEAELAQMLVERAAEAVACVVTKGVVVAMNQYNRATV